MSTYVGGKTAIEMLGGPVFYFYVCASFFFGLKGHKGGDLLYNLNTKDMDWKGKGIRAKKEADLKAEMQNIVFNKLKADLSFKDTMIINHKMRLACSDANIEWGKIKIFG